MLQSLSITALLVLAGLSNIAAAPTELPVDAYGSGRPDDGSISKRSDMLRVDGTSSSLDKRATTTILQSYKGYSYQHCNRFFGGGFTYLPTGGTTEECIDHCIAGGFEACAVWSYGQCVGTTRANDASATNQDDSNEYCHGACSGNSAEACGTDYGGLLYTAAPGPKRLLTDPYWTYKACYRDDAVGERTVKNLVSAGQGKWTIEGCLAAVKAADFSVGGIIYGGECWGSDTIPDADLVQDSSMCNWKCNDNQAELCGGEHSVDVYFTRQTSKLIDNPSWSYQGCYSDNDGGRRTLANLVTAQGPQSWTIEKCLAAVKLAGYSLGGVEYGGECWGANERRGDANKLSSSSCAMRCNDAADFTCGGVNAIDVYKRR